MRGGLCCGWLAGLCSVPEAPARSLAYGTKHIVLNLAVSEALYRFVTGSNPNVEQNSLFVNPDEGKAVVARKAASRGGQSGA